MTKIIVKIFLLSLLTLAVTSSAWAAVAGRVQFIAGNVEIIALSGEARQASKGSEIHAGETIITGVRGSAQVRMIDNGFLSIRPGSSLKIDEYRYRGKKDDTSFFSLLKGNFRALTGQIAKHNKKAWQTRTATAVLGVRGSDADIGFAPGTQLTAIRTYTGGYTLTPRDSSLPPLDVNAGGIGVFSPGSPPAMAGAFPFAPPAPRPQVGAPGSPRDEQPPAPGTPPEDERPLPPPPSNVPGVAPAPVPVASTVEPVVSGTLPPLPEQFPVASGTTVLSTPPTNVQPTTTPVFTGGPAPVGSGGVGAYMTMDTFYNFPFPSSGSMVVDGSAQKTATIGSNNELRTITDVNTDGQFKFDANTATLAKSAVVSIPSLAGNPAYTASWGVWTGNYKIVDFGTAQTPVGGFYYGYTDHATTPAELAALGGLRFNYAMVGGSAGNETGAMASSFNVSASGSFNGGVTLGSITVTGSANFPQGSTGWSFSNTGTIADLINTNAGVFGSATCTGCSTASSKADGQFIGTKAEGLLLGVHGMDFSAGKSFVGTSVLKR